MRSSACRRVLMAAMIGWIALAAMPLPVKSAQEDWVEQIAQHIREQRKSATNPDATSPYERYLTQLQRVRQALAQDNTPQVQREMGRLVAMVGTAEKGIADASAKLLLASIVRITPVEYLDSETRDHLRLIRELPTGNVMVEEPPAPSSDAPYGLPAQTRQRDSWTFGWMDKGTFHPLMGLGAGILLIVGVGVVVMTLIALGVGAPRTKKPVHTKQASGHAHKDKPHKT